MKNLESELLDWLKSNLPASQRLTVGIGDDAAVIGSMSGSCVVTTDLLTEGVDFLLNEVEPRRVGHKALGVNLSDLAAMAARPLAAFVSLALPRRGAKNRTALELAIELYRGMLPLAAKFDVVIAGGDTNTWDGPLVVSVTLLGETTAHGPLTRSSAQTGDHLVVTGILGGSLAGRHLDVEPRIREALKLADQFELHAGIDISDGLALDASRMAEASGCGVMLDLDRIPCSADAVAMSAQDGRSSLDHALADGEDFELLLAVAPETAEKIIRFQPLDIPITRIGEFIARPGLWQKDSDGTITPLEARGYQHRADS